MKNNQTQPTTQPTKSRFQLKTWQWFLVLIIATAIMAGAFLFWNRQSQVSTQTEVISLSHTDLNYCKSDDGCIIVETIEGLNYIPSIKDECGCQCVTSINKQFEELWGEKKKEFTGKLKCYKLCKMCALDMTNSKSACENNRCVIKAIDRIGEGKIKEGVSIITDKTEYKPGEIVKIEINDIWSDIRMRPVVFIFQQNNDQWEKLARLSLNGEQDISYNPTFPADFIPSYENYNLPISFSWNQNLVPNVHLPIEVSEVTATFEHVPKGRYKFGIQTQQEKKFEIIYSNEFEIK